MIGDAVTRGFLLVTACVWLAAGVYARSSMATSTHRASFASFFVLSLAGNVGVILAADVVTFYLGFTVLTLASYGLVVHERTEPARRAARVYLIMALVGEMLLLAAFVVIVGADLDLDLRDVPQRVAASAHRELVVALLLAGFGIKSGVFLVHVWLPLAYTAAPTPASAVLGGAITSAGLLGWLRFLPLGAAAMPAAGLVCLAGGFAAAFYGVAVGAAQRDAKTILAYSSISQIGFATAALGVGLANPEAAPAAVTAIVYFAVHHGVAKSALFLGAGVAASTGPGWPARLVALGLAWPALAIAGAPLTSGALAKTGLTAVIDRSPWAAASLHTLLSVAAIGSTLLLVVFLARTIPRAGERATPPAGLWLPWAALLVAGLALLVWPPVLGEELPQLLAPSKVWSATWPVGVGLAIGALVIRRRGRLATTADRVPAGDLLVVVEALGRAARRGLASGPMVHLRAVYEQARGRLDALGRLPGRLLAVTARANETLTRFGTIGLLFVLLTLVAALALFLPT